MAASDSSDRLKALKTLALILPVHVAVTAFTWRDLAARAPEQVRGGKRFWRMASGANTLGSLLYFAVGRTRRGSPQS
jgi:hypothetical protein